MYSARTLSFYKNNPEAISIPPEGPNSGYLVIQDEESTPTCCFGLCKDRAVRNLPFPQNKLLSIEYHVQTDQGAGFHSYDEVYLIPVINHPLSSNRYYAIKADGKRKGEAYASSKKEDKGTCCFFCSYVRDVKPRPFDHKDIYQQFEFSMRKTCINSNMLIAKSVAPDGYPPNFLRRKGWEANTKSPKNFTLGEAQGLKLSIRAHLPDFNFPPSQECSNSVVVGKWYCPFMFIKEGTEKDRIKKSVFYEMTLEQRWERIFNTENSYGQGKVVVIDVVVPTKVASIAGQEAMEIKHSDGKGVVWFKTIHGTEQDEPIGLSSIIMERMMWEQERVGWIKGNEKHVRVVKDEEYGGIAGWRNFGCYVLVESFVLKRNDGSIVLTYDFNHTHQIRSKWE